jgi:hypothetical protein
MVLHAGAYPADSASRLPRDAVVIFSRHHDPRLRKLRPTINDQAGVAAADMGVA